MTVIGNHSTFRYLFAIRAEAAPSCTFADANPDTITRAIGDYVANGFTAGMDLSVNYTASNDGWHNSIATVATTVLTMTSGVTLTNEGPVAATLVGVNRDKDGLCTWPLSYVRLTGSGFGDSGSTITGIPTPYDGTAFEVTCNAGAADSVFGTDEYQWYLSQRTDDPAKQYLSIATKTAGPLSSYSGTVTIQHTALATTTFGLGSGVLPEHIPLLFKYCHLYVQRYSDKAIQWVDLLQAQVANV